MLVDDKLAKEKLARIVEEQAPGGVPLFVLRAIRNTDLTDCRVESPTWLEVGALHGQVEELTKKLAAAPDQGSVRNATELAELFHDTYERLSLSFGYITREETRGWNPDSPNGRLMIAVCEAIRALPDQKE